MSEEIKLPLERERIAVMADEFGDVVHDKSRMVVGSDAVAELERAYAELQARCDKAERLHSEAEAQIECRNELRARIAQAEKDRDEAYAALASARAAESSAAKVHASQVAELTRRAENWEASHAGQERNTLAFLADLDRVTKERDEAQAKVEKLEAALELSSVGWQDHYKDLATARAEVARLKATYEAGGQCKDCDNKPPACPTCWAADKREIARLKRIEAAALANLKQGHFDEDRNWMLEAILDGIGPDGEVKP